MTAFYNRQRLVNIGAPVGGEDAARFMDIQTGSSNNGGTSGGTANAQTITIAPTFTTLTSGTRVHFIASATNTGAVTIAVNGTVYNAKKIDLGTKKDLFARDIRQNGFYSFQYDGTDLVLISPDLMRPYVFFRDNTANNVQNTTTETTLKSVTLPANIIGPTLGVSFNLFGFLGNNSGVARTFRLRMKLGATTIFDYTSTAIASSASLRPIEISGKIIGLATTVNQIASCHWLYGTSGLGLTGTAGRVATDLDHAFAGYNNIGENSANALALAFTIQMSSANTSIQTEIDLLEIQAV